MKTPVYIFSGIAGLQKEERLKHLRRYILTEREHQLHPEHPHLNDEAEKYIPIIELVYLTRNELTRELYRLFGAYKSGLEKFSHNLSEVRTQPLTPNGDPKRVFVHTHLTNFVTGHYRSWLAIAGLPSLLPNDEFEVKRVINLIDNIHVCRAVIDRRGGFPLTLAEIITWRDAEQMMTEVLTGQLFSSPAVDQSKIVFQNSKVVAVDHCLHSVADLLLDETKFQLYTAYPISKIRDIDFLNTVLGGDLTKAIDEFKIGKKITTEIVQGKRQPTTEEKEEIRAYSDLALALANEFRNSKTLSAAKAALETQNEQFRRFFAHHEQFIVYDPATIDEMPLIGKANKAKDAGQSEVRITRADCWPLLCPPQKRLASFETLPRKPERAIVSVPVCQIDALEVAIEAKADADTSTSIGRQVRSRDFRLLEQSDGVIAYRPTLGGRWSTGVQAEIEHAMEINKPFFIIKGKNDARPGKRGPMSREMAEGRDFAEWDLSNEDERRSAFQHAADYLIEQIREHKKGS